jgi:superfamily I DNA and RNA helicase
MSSTFTNQNTTTPESSSVESDEDRLDEINDLLADIPEASVGDRGIEDHDEMYVLPDPDPESGLYLVMHHSTEDGLSHVATVDTDDSEATVARPNRVGG